MSKLRTSSKIWRRRRRQSKTSSKQSAKHKGGNPYSYNNPYSDPYSEMQNDPYGAQPTPYGAQSSPYGAQPSPYGAQSSPYGAQPSPYGAQPSPYGAQSSPYGDPYGAQNDVYSSSSYGNQIEPDVNSQNNRSEYDYYDMPEFSNAQNKEPEWNVNQTQSIALPQDTYNEPTISPVSSAITPSSFSKYDDDNDNDNYIFNVPTKIKIPHLRSIPRRLKNLAKRATHKVAKRTRNYASRTKNAFMSLIGRRKNIGGKTRRRHK